MNQDIIQNIDALEGIKALPDHSVDLLIADPPYGLGKDYGNDSDKKPLEIIERMVKSSRTIP